MSKEGENMADAYVALREHIEAHNCDDCIAHYYTLLRATNIMLESIGKPHVFPNSGTPIEEKPEGVKVEKRDPFNCAKCHTIIGELDPTRWDVGGWRHEKCPDEPPDSYQREKELHEDTPETVAAKAKKAKEIGQEALRIFGRKK